MIEVMKSDIGAIERGNEKQTSQSLSGLKAEVIQGQPKIDLHKPLVRLGYEEKYKERKVVINLPDQFSAQGRILRCMRWKGATDAAEDKYGILRGELLKGTSVCCVKTTFN